jgi:hypothetical protein
MQVVMLGKSSSQHQENYVVSNAVSVLNHHRASYTNYTIDDLQIGDSLSYEGTWTPENGSFFNGTSTYCEGPGNSFTLTFTGTFVISHMSGQS